jgi:hypothetical protein
MKTKASLISNPNHETRKKEQEHDTCKIITQQNFIAKKELNKVMTRKRTQNWC